MSELGFIREILWYGRFVTILLFGILVIQAIDAWNNSGRA